MGLYRRGKVWWERYVDEGGRERRRSTRCRDRQAAALVHARTVREVELRRAGLAVPDHLAAARPIAGVIDRFCADKARAGRDGQYIQILRATLGRAAARGGWVDVTHITPQAAEAFLASLTEGRCGGRTARRRAYEALHLFCAWCLVQRPPLLAANPIDGVVAPPNPRDPVRFPLDDAEAERIMAATGAESASRYFPARLMGYKLALEAGLRAGDAEGLIVRRVRLGGLRPFLELPGELNKSGRWQSVPLTRRLAGALEAWIEARGLGAEDRVLPGRPRSRPMAADLALLGVDPAGHGDRPVDYHTLRTTFAARLLRGRVHPKSAQRLMRHADVGMLMRLYAQLGADEHADAIRVLEGGA